MPKPKLLIALPPEHPTIHSLQAVLQGTEACSGTNGSFIRAAELLSSGGYEVSLSGKVETGTSAINVCSHASVRPDDYDVLIAHQSHWHDDGRKYTFGNSAVAKSILWLHNHARRRSVGSFLECGGLQVVCPSRDHAGVYRPVRGFTKKVSVVYNTGSPLFFPGPVERMEKGRLLFIGAVTPTKGFRELMAMWSVLAQRRLPFSLAIAGSISLHQAAPDPQAAKPLGIAETEFENNEIVPWLTSLPAEYKPSFLGALTPVDLRSEIVRAEAVIVNPSWHSIETFCCAAVEAQLCSRPVFSVARGGLLETIYRRGLPTLSSSPEPAALADLIEAGLSAPAELRQKADEARLFCLSRFAPATVFRQWDAILEGKQRELPLGSFGSSPRDWMYDGLRLSGLSEVLQRRPLRR